MSNTVSRRTEDVPLYQGEDLAAVDAAREALNRELSMSALRETTGSRRLVDSTPVQELAEAYDAAVTEAAPRAVTATVRALGRKAYRKLTAAHPPRDGDEYDAETGFNRDTFFDALVEYWDLETGERTIVAPEFGSRDALMTWLNDLNDGNFTQLAAAAVRCNTSGSPDPKASAVSQVSRMSGETSQ